MNRTLVFILGMIFGIIFLFAALGIGAYVAVTVITPSMVSDELADSLGIIGDMSLLEIYQEITGLYEIKNIATPDENGNYYTLGDFAEEYNVDLTALFGFEVTDELLEIPLFSLLAEDGFTIVMDNTKVTAILSVLQDLTLPDYLLSAITGVTLTDMITDPAGVLLSGINVGGLLNVSTMSIDDLSGYDTIIYDDNDNTVSVVMYDISTDTYAIQYDDSWCIAKLSDSDLEEGEYTADDFSVIWYTESGAEASGMYQQLATYTLYALTNSEDIFDEIMDKLTLGDIMGDNIEGTMLGNLASCTVGNLANEFDEMLIGELLGYTAGSVDIEGTEEDKWYSTTTDDNGTTTYTEVTGMESVLSGLSISDLNSGDIMGELGDTEVGVLLGYIAGDGDNGTEEAVWYTTSTDGNGDTVYTAVAGLDAELANLTIDQLQSGDIMDELGDVKVGVMLGYTQDIPTDESDSQDSTTIEPMNSTTTDGDTDTNTDTEEDNRPWYAVSTDDDGNTVYTVVAGLDSVLANLTLSDLQSGDIMDSIGDTELGTMLDYTKVYTCDCEDDSEHTDDCSYYWAAEDENGNLVEVAGMDSVLADLTLTDLQGGDIMDSIGDTELGIMLDYTKVYTCDCEDDNHTEDCYYWAVADEEGNLTAVSGMDAVLADLTIEQLQSGDIMDLIGDTQLGVMLDYTWGGDIDALDGNTWYTSETVTNQDASTTTVYTPVGGMDAVLAELELNDLQGGDIMSAINETYVGVMLGYTQVWTCEGDCGNEECTADNGCYYWATSDDTAGIITVDTDTEGAETITYGEEPNYTKVSGMDSVIADLTLEQLQSGDLMGEIGDTKLGIMLDYTWGADVDPLDQDNSLDANTWYTVTTSYDEPTDTTTTVYTPISGMDAVLAEMTISELQEGDIMSAIEKTYVGVMLGYTQIYTCDCEDVVEHTSDCYYWATIGEDDEQEGIYTVVTDSESTTVTTSETPTYTAVSGMDSVIANLTLEQLQSGDLMGEIGDTKVGVMLDYTAGSDDIAGTEEGKWYTASTDADGNIVYDDDDNIVYQEVGGMDAVIADLTISELQDGNLMDHIGDTEVGVILDYTKVYTCDCDEDTEHTEDCTYTWYTTDEEGLPTEVSALDAKIASLTLNDLQDGDLLTHINDLTLAELFGYTAGSDEIAGTEEGKWYTYDENTETYTEVDAVMNALADRTLEDLQNGEIIDALDNVLLGDLLDYTAGDGETLDADGNATEVGKWYTTTDEGLEEATGLEAKLAAKTLSDLQDGGISDIVDTLTLRDVLGDDADEGIFASIGGDTMIGDLNEAIEDMLLGDLLELERQIIDTTDGSELVILDTDTTTTGTGDEQVSTTVAVAMYGTTYVMCSDYDSEDSANNVWYEAKISTSYQDETTNTVDHFQYIWYSFDESDSNPYSVDNQSTGVIATLASLTITELQDGDTLNDTINNMALGDILTIDDSSSALLLSLKDTALGDIPDAIDDTYMGTIQGLYYDETSGELQSDGTTHYTWYTDADCTAGNEVNTLTNQISNLTAGTIDDESIFDIVENLTMQDMIDCGLISLTSDNINTLDFLFSGSSWKQLTLSDFLSQLLTNMDNYIIIP